MTEQKGDWPSLQSPIFVIKIALMGLTMLSSFVFFSNGNILLFMGAIGVTVLVFFSLDPNESLYSAIFDDNLEPGHQSLNPCPKCGNDEMKRIQHKWYLPKEYRCDECEYVSNKKEAERSVLDSTLAGIGELEGKSVGTIEDNELREEVRDRLSEGWEIEEVDNKNGKVVLLTTKGGTIGGHALTGITTGLWTLGTGNVVYNKLSKKKNSKRMVLREKDNLPEDAAEPKQIESVSDKLRELKTLHDDDIISEEEFEEKKADLLEKY